jgi:hypothetical protein
MSGTTADLSKYSRVSPGQLNFINDIGYVAMALQDGSAVGGNNPEPTLACDNSGKNSPKRGHL